MTARRRLLDAFSCAGGAGMGYHLAGFDVVGVDRDPQPRYPFEHIVADAIAYIEAHAHEFDAIHGSPPCQSFTAYRRRGRGVGDGYEDLIEATREACRATGLPYVIENVEGAPLLDPVRFCGSSFGLDIRRHRLFESNVEIVPPPLSSPLADPTLPARDEPDQPAPDRRGRRLPHGQARARSHGHRLDESRRTLPSRAACLHRVHRSTTAGPHPRSRGRRVGQIDGPIG